MKIPTLYRKQCSWSYIYTTVSINGVIFSSHSRHHAHTYRHKHQWVSRVSLFPYVPDLCSPGQTKHFSQSQVQAINCRCFRKIFHVRLFPSQCVCVSLYVLTSDPHCVNHCKQLPQSNNTFTQRLSMSFNDRHVCSVISYHIRVTNKINSFKCEQCNTSEKLHRVYCEWRFLRVVQHQVVQWVSEAAAVRSCEVPSVSDRPDVYSALVICTTHHSAVRARRVWLNNSVTAAASATISDNQSHISSSHVMLFCLSLKSQLVICVSVDLYSVPNDLVQCAFILHLHTGKTTQHTNTWELLCWYTAYVLQKHIKMYAH